MPVHAAAAWIMSSMDCAPTLDVVDGPYEDEEEEGESPEIWGRLFPLNKGFVAQGTQQNHCHRLL